MLSERVNHPVRFVLTVISSYIEVLLILSPYISLGFINEILSFIGQWYYIILIGVTILLFVLLLSYFWTSFLMRFDFVKKFYLSHIVSRLIKVAFVPNTYKYTNSKYIYEYEDRKHICHCFDVSFKILSLKFDGISFKQRWTGIDKSSKSESNKFSYSSDNQRYIISDRGIDESTGYNRYKIVPSCSEGMPKVNEVISNVLFESGILEDTDGKAQPFYSKSIMEDTEKLTLELRFKRPLSKSISNVHGEIYVRFLDPYPYLVIPEKNIKKISDTHYDIYTWTVNKPIYGGKYVLRWTFSD